MDLSLPKSWKAQLKEEIDKPYFRDLWAFVDAEYGAHTCFPPRQKIFNAFEHCSFEEVRVVVIGQDPYHTKGQANGLCFSVNEGCKHPPSLINIFKELESDLGKVYPESGNLVVWAKQGVLLLNATLTVREGEAGSHQNKGWETFTDAVIKTISDKKEQMIFLLWGGYAKRKAKLIDSTKHHILKCGHPSPLSANRGYWFGNKQFSKTNFLLEQVGRAPLEW